MRPNMIYKIPPHTLQIFLYPCMNIHTRIPLYTHIHKISTNTHHTHLHLCSIVQLYIRLCLRAHPSLAQENIFRIIHKTYPGYTHFLLSFQDRTPHLVLYLVIGSLQLLMHAINVKLNIPRHWSLNLLFQRVLMIRC